MAASAVLRWAWTPVLLAGSLLTLVPLGLTGHSAAGGSHDLATNSLMIHLFAGALWAGGLLALLAHALRGGEHVDIAARRFSAVALWCFVAMAVSGVINAAHAIAAVRTVLHRPTAHWWWPRSSRCAALGVIGWRQRRTVVAVLQCRPRARAPR